MCTADPVIEPPVMVINTILSVMAYDYPPEKLSVYLSDDGGSDLTYYALREASHFAKHWLPFCKKFKVEPRSPAAYFNSSDDPLDANQSKELVLIKVKLNSFSEKELIFLFKNEVRWDTRHIQRVVSCDTFKELNFGRKQQ